MRPFLLLAVLALSAPVAVLAAPAAKGAAADDEQPALDTGGKHGKSAGTTIIGEDESPIGLYIMPWRESRPEKDVDRPARLLQEEMLPIDKGVFERQVEYYDALSKAAERKGGTK